MKLEKKKFSNAIIPANNNTVQPVTNPDRPPIALLVKGFGSLSLWKAVIPIVRAQR